MKILPPLQIKALDAFTIKNEPISSIDLMERAASNAADYLLHYYPNKPFYIFCGNGNNGGDGFAIARLLSNALQSVHCYLIDLGKSLSEDASINLERFKALAPDKIKLISKSAQLDNIPDDGIIIDALFGTGLNRPIEGPIAEIITQLNMLNRTVISIDIPSGLMAENSPHPKHSIIKATETLSFQMPKLSFLFPECDCYVGNWSLLNIGLSNSGIASSKTTNYFVDEEIPKVILKKRSRFAHKGTFGHALLIAGSYGKMGAAVLSGKACLKSGLGLLTCHIPHWGYQIMQTSVPEAMVNIDRSEMYFTQFPTLDTYAAIGIGPGLNTKPNSAKAFEQLLINNQKPMLIDADALNLLAENNALLKHLGSHTVLTPHPGEFKRLVGEWENDTEKLEKLTLFSKQHKCTTILKGAYTITCLADGTCYFNSTGNPGMASAGSGDVLSGIILSLLAQGYSCKDASILGVYLHGLSADIALNTESQESLIASDIINHLAAAFKEINNK
ncbi:NAD(P)H-hydrate dehydratase [Saccharicrinis aurantiacus]|uniref:NAD(P)H-hydrate dehydratase n=1 Tax=Saccharicrinis aurantiacus TaxID=1849719 RepID=UPI0024907A97|nr:NAD(P)H-hydrate dehydratase [Saccharicrinis aurantiacus]